MSGAYPKRNHSWNDSTQKNKQITVTFKKTTFGSKNFPMSQKDTQTVVTFKKTTFDSKNFPMSYK